MLGGSYGRQDAKVRYSPRLDSRPSGFGMGTHLSSNNF